MDSSESLFQVIKDRTIRFLRSLDEGLQSKGNKWGLNFRYPSLCLLGYCISVDPFDQECPVKGDCSVLGCEGKKFWSGSIRRRKIFPKFHLNLKVRNLPKPEKPLLFKIGAVTYDQLKDEVEFVYDSAVVYLPIRFMDYMLREIELTPVGYLARTSLVYLSFSEKFIEKILESMIENRQLLERLKFKFFMFERFKAFSSSLDAALQYEKYNPEKIDVRSVAFKRFLKECLVHTLAHLFFIFLVSKKVGVDPDRITYFIDGFNVYILENSKNNGMGFVETVKEEIKRKGESAVLNEFFNWSLEFLTQHELRVRDYQRALKEDSINSLNKLKGSEIGDKIEKLQEKIKDLNRKISAHVNLEYVDIITYRHILCQELKEWEEFEDDLSEYILPIIHAEETPSLCTDGCDECLIFYRGCNNPFAQNYTISKNLALNFFKIINRGHLSLVGKKLGNLMQDLMNTAEVMVMKIPYIDEYGFKLLLEQQKIGKKIQVVTTSNNKFLHELSAAKIPTRIEDLHAKIYFFEKGSERIFIHGSINLTKSSFLKKKENMVVIWEPSEVSRMEKEIRDTK